MNAFPRHSTRPTGPVPHRAAGADRGQFGPSPHRARAAVHGGHLSPSVQEKLCRPHGARFARSQPTRSTHEAYRPRRYATPQPATAPPRWGPPSPNARAPRPPTPRPTPTPKPPTRPRHPHSALHGATVFTTAELIPYTRTILTALFVLHLLFS
ncbi:hypothetical protein GCM10027440_38070 [Nocardiopsis coralliicola]